MTAGTVNTCSGISSRARRRRILVSAILLVIFAGMATAAFAEDAGPIGIKVQFDSGSGPSDVSNSIKILILLTALSLAPSAVIMTTSFTRILIVLGMLRRALGTQQEPPGQILAAMSLFLTIFIMMPVFQKINTDALQPFAAGKLNHEQAWSRGVEPLRKFMTAQTGDKELALFIDISGQETPTSREEIGLSVLVPAFMISELKTAFQMGFLVYLPFLVIDLVIASSLMSLGMMMLPPMMISLPIKLLFFVLADGWTLLVNGIVTSFRL